MVITPTYNMEFVRYFLHQDDIFERASDGTPKEESYPKEGLYLLAVEKNDIVGIIRIEQVNSITIKIHPYMTKRWRLLAKKMLIEFLKLFLNSQAYKLVATVPYLYKSVYNLAINMGMKLEGINRQSYLKDGIIYNQWELGMTREEIQWVVHQEK